MKKSIITIAALVAFVCSYAAEEGYSDYGLLGGTQSSGRTNIPKPSDENTVLKLDTSTGDRYQTTDVTIYKQLIANNGAENAEGNVDLYTSGSAKKLTLDAKTTESGFVVIKAKELHLRASQMIITNTSDLNNTISVNVEKTEISTNNQGSSLSTDSNIDWYGNIDFLKEGKLSVSKKTFTLKSGSNMYFKDTTAELSIGASSAFTVEEGATVNNVSKMTQLSGSTMTIKGAFSADSALTLAKTEVDGGTFSQSAGGVTLQRALIIKNGGTFTAYGSVTANNGASGNYNAGSSINISGADSKLIITRDADNKAELILADSKNGTKTAFELDLNTANAIVDNLGNGVTIKTGAKVEETDKNHVMNVSQAQKFAAINLSTSSLDMYLNGSSFEIELTDTNSFSSEGGTLNIFNFRENAIKVGDDSSVKSAIEQYIKLYDTNNELLGNASVLNGYITLATNVPEPAEWAAILGALALGLAIYRRRK